MLVDRTLDRPAHEHKTLFHDNLIFGSILQTKASGFRRDRTFAAANEFGSSRNHSPRRRAYAVTHVKNPS